MLTWLSVNDTFTLHVWQVAVCSFSPQNKSDFSHHANIYQTAGAREGKGEAAELPFDEEHELSLSVCGADDAFRLEVSAEVCGGIWALVARLEDVALALQSVGLLLGLQAGLREKDKDTRTVVRGTPWGHMSSSFTVLPHWEKRKRYCFHFQGYC